MLSAPVNKPKGETRDTWETKGTTNSMTRWARYLTLRNKPVGPVRKLRLNEIYETKWNYVKRKESPFVGGGVLIRPLNCKIKSSQLHLYSAFSNGSKVASDNNKLQ